MAPSGLSAAERLKRTEGPVGQGPSVFHLSGPKQPADALPWAVVEGVGLFLPSTQQLGHLVTPGDREVHLGGSLFNAQIQIHSFQKLSSNTYKMADPELDSKNASFAQRGLWFGERDIKKGGEMNYEVV
jgi:hypothetical protein